MTEPLTTEIIDSELTEDAEAWVLREGESGGHLTIPDPNFPGKEFVHFFLKREDAEEYALKLRSLVEHMKDRNIIPVSVKLKEAIRSINALGHPYRAAVHGPNEMYDYFDKTGGAT